MILKIESLKLLNYKGFQNLDIKFTSPITCLAGINGSGKTSILNAIALCLSWIIARMKSQNGKGLNVNKELDLYSSAKDGLVEGNFTFNNEPIKIRQSFATIGAKVENGSDYASLSAIFEYVNSFIQQDQIPPGLPVLVYYPTNRSILDIPMRIRLQHEFTQFSTYDKALDASVRFRDFFEWYRDREDIENAEKNAKRDFDYKDALLSAVRDAIYKCIPEYKNLHIKRTPQLMVVEKNGVELPLNSLSDGEKCFFSLIGDLARRLAIASSYLDNPLQGNGIVLIDEIDLHLHPAWQRKIVHLLPETFPNCQFIITTHSPQVLGELPTSSILMLNKGSVYNPKQSIGLTSNDILSTIMDYDDNDKSMIRDDETDNLLKELAASINMENFTKAQKLIEEIEKRAGGPINETRKYKTEIKLLLGVKDGSNT